MHTTAKCKFQLELKYIVVIMNFFSKRKGTFWNTFVETEAKHQSNYWLTERRA